MMFNIDLSKYRIVDLSYEVVPPGSADRPFVIERGYLADMAYKYDITKTHSHVGTHVETPAHFFDGGKDVVDLPLTTFFGRGILLDIDKVGENPAITAEIAEKAIGDIIKDGDIVIPRNSDQESLKGSKPKPYLTPESAKWLKDHNIKLLGIDNNIGLSKDIPTGRELHAILMGANIPIIEWLDNLDQLKKREFYVMALPFKVKIMDSSWARVIAIEDI
ncbi:MAG: cyclase family protein [Candidatus Poribacteria bacterium]